MREEGEEKSRGFREEAYRAYGSLLGWRVNGGPEEDLHYARRLVRRHFPSARGARILDLGCGTGSILVCAVQEGYREVTGVDLSLENVEAARRRGLHDVRHEDAFAVLDGGEAETFDVVLTIDVLEHLTRNEALRLSEGVARILRPSGRWLIHVPNGSSPLGGRIRYGDLTHEMAYTTSSLAQLLRIGGFRDLAFYEDTPVVHGVRSALRAAAWSCVRLLLRVYLAVETGNSGANEVFSQNLLAVARKAHGKAGRNEAPPGGTRDPL